MKIYKEVKKIACKVAQVDCLIKMIAEKLDDVEGIDWHNARLIDGLTVKGKYLYEGSSRIAEEADDYYVNQWTGYCEDDYYGYLYFKIDVPGQYVKVYYEC